MMGSIILNTDKKSIRISEFLFWKLKKRTHLYQIKGIDSFSGKKIIFNSQVTSIVFNQCHLCGRFELELSSQLIEFKDCIFEKANFTIQGGNLSIQESSFFSSILTVCQSDCVEISLTPNSKFLVMNITSNDLKLSGHHQGWPNWNINTHHLIIDSLTLLNGMIHIMASSLEIRNSNLTSNQNIHFVYQKLAWENSTVVVNGGSLSFFEMTKDHKKGKEIATYFSTEKQSVIFNDSNFLDSKKHSLYSLLSILKGINQKIQSQSHQTMNSSFNELSKDYDILLEKVDSQINVLQQKKENILGDFEQKKIEIQQDVMKQKIKNFKE